MKTSARNYFEGAVLCINHGAVNDEVEIVLDSSNTRMTAIITSNSTKSLGLEPGKKVIALIKAQWVILVDGHDGIRYSARNQLPGTVVSVKKGVVNAEVNMRLDGGESMTIGVIESSLNSMGIEAGMRLVAMVKASHVILGVKQ